MNFEEATPHALRQTFGTRWLPAGGDIYKLSKVLGHSSLAVTETHYAQRKCPENAAASLTDNAARPPQTHAESRDLRQILRTSGSTPMAY